jgi:DNA (cytosine-5)-methyltransferase 1
MVKLVNKLKTGPWNLSDLKKINKNNKTVFSCFHCGGGSTMGYKLAGYDVIGGVEIDPEMMRIYKLNHNPKYSYLMGVQEFKNIPNKDLPKELFNLDILDGSPPCSSFSMAGSREDAWGDKKKFREGQVEQVLDNLFFDFIDIANKLKPKVVVAENVKGLIIGKAKGYVKEIFQSFDKAGYDVQLFLLNSAFMGVPQKRERTFFIARRKDLNLPQIKLNFNETPITIKEAISDLIEERGKSHINSINYKYFKMCKLGEAFSKYHPKGSLFNWKRLNFNEPCPTITSSFQSLSYRPEDMICLSDNQIKRLQSFPDDYNFNKTNVGYMCGMSVPPYMMQRVADQIYKQLLK